MAKSGKVIGAVVLALFSLFALAFALLLSLQDNPNPYTLNKFFSGLLYVISILTMAAVLYLQIRRLRKHCKKRDRIDISSVTLLEHE